MLSLEYRVGLGEWFTLGKVASEGVVRRTCKRWAGLPLTMATPPNVPNNLGDDTPNCSAAHVGHAPCASLAFHPVMTPACTGES